jgi:hypothetical protein
VRGRLPTTGHFFLGLGSRLLVAGVFRPVLLELGFVDFEILHHVGVVEQNVVASAGLIEFLLNGQPGGFIDPHLNFSDLSSHLFRFRRQVEHDSFFVVQFFFAAHADLITFFQVFALGAKTETGILIDHRAVLAKVIFLDAIQLRVVDEQGISSAQHGAWLGLGDVNAHLLIVMNPDLAGLRRFILHDGGVFHVLKVSRETVEVLRGLVHHLKHGVGGPLLGSLCGGACGNSRDA